MVSIYPQYAKTLRKISAQPGSLQCSAKQPGYGSVPGAPQWKLQCKDIMEYYAITRNDEITQLAATGMELKNLMLSQKHKDKYQMFSLI